MGRRSVLRRQAARGTGGGKSVARGLGEKGGVPALPGRMPANAPPAWAASRPSCLHAH